MSDNTYIQQFRKKFVDTDKDLRLLTGNNEQLLDAKVSDVEQFILTMQSDLLDKVERLRYSCVADEINGDYTDEEKKNPLVAYNAALKSFKKKLTTLRKELGL